jgi:ATP-grasp ribosomal peptide maturase
MTVVVFSHWFDPTADHVVAELNRREIPVFRCDGADFPQRLTMTATLDGTWTGTLRNATRTVELREVSGILYRRPTDFEFPEGMPDQVRRWSAQEARIGFGGLLASLDSWLNHPHHIAFAEYKPVQLQAAARAGLDVPRTLIANSPDAARSFCEDVGQVIYKPFGAGGITDNGEAKLIYATRIPPGDFGHPGVALTACLFQEWVEHDYAVRAAAIDGRIFASAIHAGSPAAHTDWRSDYDSLHYEPAEIPPDVARGVRSLMASLRLRFGVLDFLVRPDGSYVYLEINPNGQWAWIDDLAKTTASAIADALMKGPPDDLG